MKRLLNYRLFFPLFLAADDGGGGGGAAAVIDPPASAGADADASDLLTYEPPDAGSVADFIAGDSDEIAAPEPKPRVEKKAEVPDAKKVADDKAAADKKAAAEKAAPDKKEPKGEPPVAKLRERLKELEAQKVEMEKQLELAKTDKRVDELTSKIAEKEKAIGEREKQLADTERKLLIHNPLVSKKLRERADAFNAEYNAALQSVPSLKSQYRPLLDELAEITGGDQEEYPDALRAFKGKLKETFDDDAGEVMNALRKGLAFRADHARIAEEVQRDAVKIEMEERKREWTAGHDKFEKEFDKWLEPPPDAATNDPLNHKLYLRRFEEALPKEDVAKVNSNVKVFLDRVFNGAAPRSKEDFPGMTDDQIAEQMREIDARVTRDREMAPALITVGLKLAAYFRPIIARMQKLEEAANGKRAGQPPDPTKHAGSDRSGGGKAADEEDELPSPDDVAALME